MVVEVVAEKLDVGDCGVRDRLVREVAGEEDEGDVADVVRVAQAGQAADLERRVAVREEDLGRVLDLREAARVDEFLIVTRIRISTSTLHSPGRSKARTCKNTLPKILSVSSLNTVLNITVTRSGAA